MASIRGNLINFFIKGLQFLFAEKIIPESFPPALRDQPVQRKSIYTFFIQEVNEGWNFLVIELADGSHHADR